MSYQIESRTLTAQATVVIRASIPAAQLPAWLAGTYDQVQRFLTDHGIRAEGPPFARFAVHADAVTVEAGYPVLTPVPGSGRVTPSRLPGGPAAVTIHFGNHDDLGLARQAVADWLKEKNLEAAEPHWEVYYTNPGAQPAPVNWSTEVVTPYRTG
ncbi:GyrI-like domain-containing protein [Paractinoplanes durhamensis]|uniref:Transcription activator effector-binding protein n=1 Tax=Paractinoplanes durhamensis TaxID=113563 RepID=A0ABQ3YRR3_9ACTN|nr:GyrI-like domain-containing protein [Actinoplanes durhamensis]GIE00217.1 transcription activator effector-binding protein [Actinoplanes durhamensis]